MKKPIVPLLLLAVVFTVIASSGDGKNGPPALPQASAPRGKIGEPWAPETGQLRDFTNVRYMQGISTAPGSTFSDELACQIDGAWKIQENHILNVMPDELMHMVVLRSGSSFFSSSDGSRSGFMQTALPRRTGS